MERSVKRLSIILMAAFFVFTGLFFAACDDKEEPQGSDPVPSAEQGDYYYAAEPEDYTLSLVLGNTFTLSIAGDDLSGTYEMNGEQVTLTADGAGTYTATYYNDAVSLTYKNASYRFLRKIDYTVTFDTAGGSSVGAATVLNGKTVAKPQDPTKAGTTFVGWYTDSGFKTLFSFTQPITANMTLHARFVENIDPEFEISFNANHVGAAEIPSVTTVGHKLFELPVPEWEDHTFLGWWFSDYGDDAHLTAQYEEQLIEEPKTFYAVWESEDDLAVSVSSTGIKWQGRRGNNSYTVNVTGPNGAVVDNMTTGVANYDVDFASYPEGDYTVSVTVGGKTSRAYYKNKALARVSAFEVEGSKLLFNAVPNATDYKLTVLCATPEHAATHLHDPIDLRNETSYDFSLCDMRADGITFTVEAVADGYVPSTSESFSYTRKLDPVSGLSIDASKDSVSWNSVGYATSYSVVVTLDGQEVYNRNTTETSLDLQYYDSGAISVSVTPVAFGYISPAAAQQSYTKARLATPQSLRLENSTTVAWDPVKGANGYKVLFDGKEYNASSPSIDLGQYYDSSKSEYVFTVYALGATAAQNSLSAPDFTIRNGVLGNVKYEAGYLTWDAVFGYDTFLVKVGSADPVEVSKANSLKIVFTEEGDIDVSVAIKTDGAPDYKTVQVKVYSIQFDVDGGVESFAPLYKAQGDPFDEGEIPASVTLYGYTFSGWFSEKNGEGRPFDGTTFEDAYSRTVYAKWSSNEYHITLRAGTHTDESYYDRYSVLFGLDFELPVPAANDEMYAFAGWYNGSTQYADWNGKSSSEYLYAGDMTLTAKWVPVLSFSKTTDGNGWRVGPGEGINYVTEITIPSIYNQYPVVRFSAFACGTLEVINIPDTIEDIMLDDESFAFRNCTALTHINIYQANESGPHPNRVYYSVNGVLFQWNTGASRMELRYYPYARQDSEYTVPATIEGVVVDEGIVNRDVTTIPTGAFIGATGAALQTLNLPATISLIEENAIDGFAKLTKVVFLPAENGHEATGLQIRPDAFGTSSHIMSIRLPKRLGEVPNEAFDSMSYLAYLEVESGGKYSAVDGLLLQTGSYGLELVYYPHNRHVDAEGKAYIPETYTTSGRATEFVVPTEIFAIGEGAVKNISTIQKVVITRQVQYIGKSAFEGLYNLKELIFEGEKLDPDLTIDERAFLGEHFPNIYSPNSSVPTYTTGLISLTLPANLKKIGQYAFGALSGSSNTMGGGLKEVTLNVDRESVEYATGAFSGTLPGATSSVSHIATLHFGAGVPEFEILNVFGPNIKEIHVAEGNPHYWTDPQGVLYAADKETLILVPATFDQPYIVPETVTKIQSGMFKERTLLPSVTIHGKVTEIGDSAFEGCTSLKEVIFLDAEESENPTGLTIMTSAFAGCTAIPSLKLPKQLVYLGDSAFENCKLLTSVELPARLKDLEMNGVYGDMEVFQGCTSLTDLTVAAGSKYFTVQDHVLYSVREAKLSPDAATSTYVPDRAIYTLFSTDDTITVPGTVRTLGKLAFSRTSVSEYDLLTFTKVEFEDYVQTYDPKTGEPDGTEMDFDVNAGSETKSSLASPFYNLKKLKEVKFPAGLKVMCDYLFNYNSALTKVNVPYTVTSVQPRAFYYSNAIEQIVFDPTPADAEEVELRIEDAATVQVQDHGTQVLQQGIFGRMSKLKTIEFPARLSYLGSNVFYVEEWDSTHANYYYSALTSVKFADKPTKTLTLGPRAFYNSRNLQAINLPDTVTEIPDYAFYYSHISSIEIPKSVKRIGNNAFYYCSSLTHIDLPSSVTEIGNSAFSGTKLTSIDLPEGLETIGNSAFGLASLEGTLKIPTSVTSIGTSAFSGSHFSKVEIPAGNKLASVGASAFASMTLLTEVSFGEAAPDVALTFGNTIFAGTTALTSFRFPANVKEIGASMFANLTGLTEVTFAEGTSLLEKVGDLAFSKTGLTSLSLPASSAESGIELGLNLFKSCTGFTTLYLSASVTSIEGALSGCASLSSITIDPANQSFESDETLPIIYAKENGERGAIKLVYGELNGPNSTFHIAEGGTQIGTSAFANQTELEVVYIPASIRQIGDYAFQNCVNLKRVIIMPGSVLESIGKGAFMNCWSLEYINLEQATHLSTFGDGNFGSSVSAAYNGVFMYAGIKSASPLKIKLPASVEKLGTYMFANSGAAEIDLSACTKVTAIPTGGSSSPIFYGFFSGNKNLTRVKLPSSIVYIGTAAFADCPLLGTQDNGVFDISNLTKLEYFGTSAGTAPGTSSYSLYTFANDTGLRKIVFPTSVKSAGGRMFYGCSNLETVEGLENTDFIAGYAYSDSGIQSITISTVAKYMFLNCSRLTNVTFGAIASFTNMDYMFQNCTALKKVDMSALTGLAELKQHLFDGCTGLEEVVLPTGTALKHLGQYTFQNCTSLKRINSGKDGTIDLSGLLGLVRISSSSSANVGSSTNSYLFNGCSSIKEVIFPKTLLQIGGYAFQGCTSLTKIDFSGLTTIGQYAFTGSGLTSVTIPASMTNVYMSAFTDCPNLKDVVFAEGSGTVSVMKGSSAVKLGAFGGSGVQNVTFSSRITELTAYMFYNCTALQSIEIPATITGSFGSNLFTGCTSLKNVTFAPGLTMTALGSYMFQNCTSLQSVDLSGMSKLTSLGTHAFEGCTDLTSVTLPKTVNYLGTNTFQNCVNLQELDISETAVQHFRSNATSKVSSHSTTSYLFDGCINLKEVKTKPGQIQEIAGYTFSRCESLKSFDLSGATVIGSLAFKDSGIENVTIPKTATFFFMSVNTYDRSPFEGCDKLQSFTVEGGELEVTVYGMSSSSYVKRTLKVIGNALCLVDKTKETTTCIGVLGSALDEDGTLDMSGADYEDVALAMYLFESATNIKKVILPEDLTTLPKFLFYNSSVEEVVLPKNLTELPESIFDGSMIKSVSIPASVANLAKNAFANTPNLDEVTFEAPAEGEEPVPLNFAGGSSSVSSPNSGVFFNSAIKRVAFPERTEELSSSMFNTTKHLESVTFPKNITKLPNYLFACSELPELFLTDNITELGTYVYSHCTFKNGLTLDEAAFKNLEVVGQYAFEYIEDLGDVVIPDTVKEVQYGAFRYSGVKNVTIPGTTKLGTYIFDACTEIENVIITDISEGEESGSGTFAGIFRNSSVKTVKLGEGMTAIGSTCFLNCTSLTSVELPHSLTTIDYQAFDGCTALKSLVIYDEIASIACGSSRSLRGAFAGWTSEQTIYFTASRSYISSLVGLDWASNAAYQLEANLVFGYVPEG